MVLFLLLKSSKIGDEKFRVMLSVSNFAIGVVLPIVVGGNNVGVEDGGAAGCGTLIVVLVLVLVVIVVLGTLQIVVVAVAVSFFAFFSWVFKWR